MIKILNLYSGIGGNRKLWKNVKVTAVEIIPAISDIYRKLHPRDIIVIGDAHEFLLDHYSEFDFIWSSPPCQTHSQIRYRLRFLNGEVKAVYPDMRLWQEIIFLQKYFLKGRWIVENTETFYNPLIEPQRLQRHYFWANFEIPPLKIGKDSIRWGSNDKREDWLGISLKNFNAPDKRQLLRNCVHPILGKHILDSAYKK